MTPELLAPAGGPEAVRAAVCAGADAIYLGAAAFGARATAGFSPEDLRTAIRFAHFHGRKIYVTVNTLVKDGEWAPLRDALGLLRDLRADAVLIQDLGVLRLCRAEFPELTLHASTQMSLHTPAGIHGRSRNRSCDRRYVRRDPQRSGVVYVTVDENDLDIHMITRGRKVLCRPLLPP